jgi:hypothetical protein
MATSLANAIKFDIAMPHAMARVMFDRIAWADVIQIHFWVG